MKNEKLIYNIKDVSILLGISTASCRNLFQEKDFPSIKIGKRFFVEKNQLQKYLENKED